MIKLQKQNFWSKMMSKINKMNVICLMNSILWVRLKLRTQILDILNMYMMFLLILLTRKELLKSKIMKKKEEYNSQQINKHSLVVTGLKEILSAGEGPKIAAYLMHYIWTNHTEIP